MTLTKSSPIFHITLPQTSGLCLLDSSQMSLLPIACFTSTLSLISTCQSSSDSLHSPPPPPHSSCLHFATETIFPSDKFDYVTPTPKTSTALHHQQIKFQSVLQHSGFACPCYTSFLVFSYSVFISICLVLRPLFSKVHSKEHGFFEMLLEKGFR